MLGKRLRRVRLLREQNKRISGSSAVRLLYEQYTIGTVQNGTAAVTVGEEFELKKVRTVRYLYVRFYKVLENVKNLPLAWRCNRMGVHACG